MQDQGRRKRNRRRRLSHRKRITLIGNVVVVFCLVFPAYAPEASDKGGLPARPAKQQPATLAARKETLNTLLSTAGKLRRANDTQKAVQTLNEAGHLQLDLNLNKEALTTFQQSHALLDQGTDQVTTVDTLNGLASAYLAVDNYAEAKLLVESARTISEQNNYPAGKAEALLLLSQCQNQKNHATAINTAGEALSLWQSIGNNRGVVRSHLFMGQYYVAQTSLPEATQNFQAAADLAGAIGDSRLKAESLMYQGYVEYRKAAWQDLISLFTSAEELIDAEAEPFLMGQITAGFAEAFIETGLPEVGLEKYQQAVNYYRQTSSPAALVGMSWGIGRALYGLERYPEALTILQQTVADAESNHLTSWMAQSHDYLGRTYAAMNQHELALEHFQAALPLYGDLGNPIEQARVYSLIAQGYEARGKSDDAMKLYQRALGIFDTFSDRVDQSVTLFGMARLETKRGDYDAAEHYLSHSIETTEDVRSMSSSTRDLTVAFSATVHDRYLQYVHCLMRRNDKQAAIQAFEISESERARSLVEFLRHTETNLAASTDPELAKQEQSLRHLIRAKEDDRVTLIAGKSGKEELAKLNAQLAQLQEQYKSVSANISKRYPAYNQITQPRGWDLARIQKQVVNDDDTILLEYIVGADQSYVWAITRNSVSAHEIPADVGKAAETVYNLLKGPAQSDSQNQLTGAAQALSQMVLSPVAAELNKRRIIVIADGALNYIPFQMLPSPSSSEPLVAQHEIINAPSASVLGELREEVASRGVRSKVLAAFGNPAFGPAESGNDPRDEVASARTESGEHLRYALRDIDLNGDSFDRSAVGELFYAEREINSLREIATPAATFSATGFAANREQLFSMDFSQYAILHFATHGLLDPKRPEHSGILLSTVDDHGKELKGFIGLQDVYSLRAPVDLVVLSACRTGLGKEIRGEGLVGLTRGFMYAGATTVVASLWKVNDEATAELMKRFYIEMLQHRKTPDEALRIAQNSIRQKPEWSAPHYWAGFTLQGEYKYVVNSERGWKRYSTLIVIGIVMMVLVSIAGWYRYRLRAGSSAVKK
jgi:CHAT domain-containing protein